MKTIVVTCTVLCLALFPAASFAYDESGDGGWDVDRSRLADEAADTIPLPVLFGVDIERVTPDFGQARGGGTRTHEGQDLLAPKGTPIVSPTEAIVIRTGDGESSGKYVYTANPGGETFRYMHLDTIARLEPGDRLKAGDFIGTVGDTGNAPDGVYHLHLEIRDEDNVATDPYPRLQKTFTLKQKVSFLAGIFSDIRNDAEYAGFLVTTFSSDFKQAVKDKYTLPRAVKTALQKSGTVASSEKEDSLRTLIATIPKVISRDLVLGETGPEVMLLQIYLTYNSEGVARDRLAASGITGYYGPVTAAAVAELQGTLKQEPTGLFTAKTRTALVSK